MFTFVIRRAPSRCYVDHRGEVVGVGRRRVGEKGSLSPHLAVSQTSRGGEGWTDGPWRNAQGAAATSLSTETMTVSGRDASNVAGSSPIPLSFQQLPDLPTTEA